jgi:hypothetical protein
LSTKFLLALTRPVSFFFFGGRNLYFLVTLCYRIAKALQFSFMELLGVGSQRMAKFLEHRTAKKSAQLTKKVASRRPGTSKAGRVEPNKGLCCSADDKQMQKLLKHCCGAIAARFEEWQWYTK